MNPNHLTPNVRKQVVEAIEKLREIKKAENSHFSKTGQAFPTLDELKSFFYQFYEKVKDEVDNDFDAFGDLCLIEDKYGAIAGCLGGATLDSDKETVIKID